MILYLHIALDIYSLVLLHFLEVVAHPPHHLEHAPMLLKVTRGAGIHALAAAVQAQGLGFLEGRTVLPFKVIEFLYQLVLDNLPILMLLSLLFLILCLAHHARKEVLFVFLSPHRDVLRHEQPQDPVVILEPLSINCDELQATDFLQVQAHLTALFLAVFVIFAVLEEEGVVLEEVNLVVDGHAGV